MNLLSVLLDAATTTGASQANGMLGFLGKDGGMWVMMIAVFAIMYFFMIRPQNKKQKEIANFRKGLETGQKIITAGGIHGKIKDIKDDVVLLEIADNVRIKIDKSSIFASAPEVTQDAAK